MGLLFFLLFFLFFLWPASILAQDDPTSTPDPEGNIYYIVQPNDSLWSIAARSGLRLQELLELNGITEDTVVNPGDQLLIGRGEPPATPTSDVPTATLPPPFPSATPVPIRTAVCMAAFDDVNRNGKFENGEGLLPGVAFTVFNDQTVVANYITDGVSEPFCLESLLPGTYHVTRSISPNEILTTKGDWALTLIAGSELNLSFGSYKESERNNDGVDTETLFETRIAGTPAATPTSGTATNENTIADTPLIMLLLGIGVFALLLAAAVLLFWIAYSRKSDSLSDDEEN